jgi:hypothetical protein
LKYKYLFHVKFQNYTLQLRTPQIQPVRWSTAVFNGWMFPTKWRHHISRNRVFRAGPRHMTALIFSKLFGPWQDRWTFLRVRAQMWIIFGKNFSHMDKLSWLWTHVWVFHWCLSAPRLASWAAVWPAHSSVQPCLY